MIFKNSKTIEIYRNVFVANKKCIEIFKLNTGEKLLLSTMASCNENNYSHMALFVAECFEFRCKPH